MHSLWKGALSFGLVHIPVKLYSASRSREFKLKLLHKKDLGEIRYARICKADGKEIPWEEIVKGYPTNGNGYVILTEEDFTKASLEKSKSIEIVDFTKEGQIDYIYYGTPYYIEPEKGAAKAYTLLCEALKKSRKIAVGRFVFHHHEHLGAIHAQGNLLILHLLRYKAEILNPKALELPSVKVPKNELNAAMQLIAELSRPFHPEKYSDTFMDTMKEIIKKKAKGKQVHIEKVSKERPQKIHDILTLLKASLKEQKKKKKAA